MFLSEGYLEPSQTSKMELRLGRKRREVTDACLHTCLGLFRRTRDFLFGMLLFFQIFPNISPFSFVTKTTRYWVEGQKSNEMGVTGGYISLTMKCLF